MLRTLTICGKEIPVPIPLKTLDEAVMWVEKTFVRKDDTITRIFLNGKDILSDLTVTKKKLVELNDKSVLEIQVDSPKDLSIQTLDAMRGFAAEIEMRLKDLAVNFWQFQVQEQMSMFVQIRDDLSLMLELVDHVNGMLNYSHEALAPVNGLTRLIRRTLEVLDGARQNSDWKLVARVLLNRLEPLLTDLVRECETLQVNILTISAIPNQAEASNLFR